MNKQHPTPDEKKIRLDQLAKRGLREHGRGKYVVTPFRAWHLKWLMARGNPAEGVGAVPPENALRDVEKQNSWTGVWSGDPIAAGGTMMQWPGRHTAWMFLPVDSGPHMLWITREVARNLRNVVGRVEMTVRKDFEAGHRWAKMLGFDVETPLLRAYGPQGEDHVGYVRFN